jgi:hypothetical protein
LELTLGWSAREISESLFETLIGTYNPAFSKGLGGLYGGYARLTTNKNSQSSTFHFHDFSYIAGLTVSGTLSNGVGALELRGTTAAEGTLVASRSNSFFGKLGGVEVHFSISAGQAAALTASVPR